jgi:sirohydrochlorin cobaltochelatase
LAETSTLESNLLIIVGYTETDELGELANALSKCLRIPVQTAFLEGADCSVGESIQAGVAEHHPQHVIVMPLFLGASTAKKNNLQEIIAAAQDRWPEIAFYYGKPLGTHEGVVTAYSQLLKDVAENSTKSALVVIGRGSRDPESNFEVYEMARLLWEKFQSDTLEVAFTGMTKPDMAAAVQWCMQFGTKRLLVLPYLLYETNLFQKIQTQLAQIQAQNPNIEMILAPHLGLHEGIIDAVSQRYQAIFAKSSDGRGRIQIRPASHSHGAGGTHTHRTADFHAMLPPRYQNEAPVSAAPMGAADLVFDAEGRVAWDEIWGSFCELALAGGPPHRGTLLEPVSPETIAAAPERHQQVLAELERGIRMITQLPVLANKSPGWIGIQCKNEEMALWLLRAIIVENVSVRREDDVIYLPAGPDFRLEYEIKNIITVVAKTHHYWTEHISAGESKIP